MSEAPGLCGAEAPLPHRLTVPQCLWPQCLANQISGRLVVVSGIISVQFGAALGKDLFTLVPPTAIVGLRLITSAIVLLIMARYSDVHNLGSACSRLVNGQTHQSR